MLLFPFSGFAKLPSIYNITIEDELVAGMVPQKMNNFPDMGIVDAQVDVGKDNGPVMRFQIVQGFIKLGSLF
jgi:hypothetical protein